MNTGNYLEQIPGDIFLRIAKYLEKSDLHTILKTSTSLKERIKDLFLTLYILPEGRSMGMCHEVFFKDTIDLEACRQTIKEGKLRHLALNFSRWKEDHFPRIVFDGTIPIDITSIRVFFKIFQIADPLPRFIETLKNTCFQSLKKLCLTPVVVESEYKKTLGTVKQISSTIQKDLFRMQQSGSLEEVLLDFPGYKLIANDALYKKLYPEGLPVNILQQERKPPTQSIKRLLITIEDTQTPWNFSPKITSIGECRDLEELSIDYSQNKSTFENFQELEAAISQTYRTLRLATSAYPRLKRLFITPSFFGTETTHKELQEIEQLIQKAFLKNLKIFLNPTRLYEQAGENQGILQKKLQALQQEYNPFLEIQGVPERTCVVVIPPEEINDEYCMELIEALSKEPQEVELQLQSANIPLLNSIIAQYESVEKVTLQIYNEKDLLSEDEIQLLRDSIGTLISKFPKARELHFKPGRLQIPPQKLTTDQIAENIQEAVQEVTSLYEKIRLNIRTSVAIETDHFYDIVSHALNTFPEMWVIFYPPTIRHIVPLSKRIENPRFKVNHAYVQ